jgi:hypothetical protein
LKRHVVSSATERRCSCSTAIVSLSQQKEGLPYNTALGEFPNSLEKYECWDHVTVRYRKVIWLKIRSPCGCSPDMHDYGTFPCSLARQLTPSFQLCTFWPSKGKVTAIPWGQESWEEVVRSWALSLSLIMHFLALIIIKMAIYPLTSLSNSTPAGL